MIKRGKRGQLTIFIILAVLVVAGVAMFFILRGSAKDKPSGDLNTENIYNYVLLCLEETSDYVLQEIYEQGGYFEIPEEILFEYFAKDYPYYYINSEIHVPTESEVEREFGNYISNRIKYCLDFETFESEGYDIQAEEISASFNIKTGYVEVELDYPLFISKEQSSAELRKFSVALDSNLKEILDLSQVIVEDYSINPGFICFTCLEEYNKNTEFSVSSQKINYGSEPFLFSIDDPKTEFDWRFVVEK